MQDGDARQDGYLIGLDFGTESARGVLIDVGTGKVEDTHAIDYPHGVMTEALPDGIRLPPAWALQNASDYTETAAVLLGALGRGREIHGIGIGFTASTPLPARADGAPLSAFFPDHPHAYVKLWKHQAAQPWADRISVADGSFLENFGGRISGEWLPAKAAQLAEEAPDIWQATDRFIEAGDWLVWQLCGSEKRGVGLAAYKAQYRAGVGYPDMLPGLQEKLGEPGPIGTPAGALTEVWRERTGIRGAAVVAVAAIDSHVVMPAVGGVDTGVLVGALGTSAVFLLLDDMRRPLPRGIEGVVQDGVIPGLWCYEAGQAGFGDVLVWFVRMFPRGKADESFAWYNAAAGALRPGENHLVALDWWNGCRVPFSDSALSGLMLGMNLRTKPADIYRALLDSLCFGARNIADCFIDGGVPIDRVVLTGGLSQNNPILMQLMADALGRDVEVPVLSQPTAVGAAIHGAVAAGIVSDFARGASRFGATEYLQYHPRPEAVLQSRSLYEQYRSLSRDPVIRRAMHALDDRGALGEPRHLAPARTG
jgi:L-ribulokinase